MGLFSYTVAGGGFILIGAWESLVSSPGALKKSSPSSTTQSPAQNPSTDNQDSVFSSCVTFVLILILSSLFVLDSLLSLFDAVNSKDNIGSVLQLQIFSCNYLEEDLPYFLLNQKRCTRGSTTVLSNINDLWSFKSFHQKQRATGKVEGNFTIM